MAGLIEIKEYPSDADTFLHSFATAHIRENVFTANLPVQGWGYLIVIKQAYDQYLQVFYTATGRKHYIRSSREGAWCSWVEL